MKRKGTQIFGLLVASAWALVVTGCGGVHAQDGSAGAPPAAKVVPFGDAALFSVERPDQFPLAAATEHPTTSELIVTGTVTPDVARQVPVPSLATGRIVEIDARLGDQVNKGALLFKVRSTDIAGAFSNYRQALKNEELSKIQLDRANTLFAHGAIPKSGQEIAQNDVNHFPESIGPLFPGTRASRFKPEHVCREYGKKRFVGPQAEYSRRFSGKGE